MKRKTLSEMADLRTALDHLDIARRRLDEAREPSLSLAISSVILKLKLSQAEATRVAQY